MLYGISLACHMTPLDTEALISRFKRWNLDDQIFVACCDQNNRVCHSVIQSVSKKQVSQLVRLSVSWRAGKPANQSVSQSFNQPVNQSASLLASQLASQEASWSVSQPASKSVSQPPNKLVSQSAI